MPNNPYVTPASWAKGFSGYVLHTLDDGTWASIYGFTADQFEYDPDGGASFPETIDNSAVLHDVVLGINTAQFVQSGPVHVERGLAAFLNSAFGPRTNGGLTPFFATISDAAGATPYCGAGEWFSTFQIGGSFGVSGSDSQIRYRLASNFTDPLNTKGAAASAAPGLMGTGGNGISTFGRCSYTNGNTGSLVTYDGVRSWSLQGNNGLAVQPSVSDPTNRLAPGMTPDIFRGMLVMTQNKQASNPLPRTDGFYTINVLVPTGDGTHTMTVALSVYYSRRAQRYRATDFNTVAITYSVLGGSAINGTANYPFVASYA